MSNLILSLLEQLLYTDAQVL